MFSFYPFQKSHTESFARFEITCGYTHAMTTETLLRAVTESDLPILFQQ